MSPTRSVCSRARSPARTAIGASDRVGVLLWVAILGTGLYGAYFGAAQGVLMMGFLGLFLTESLQRPNGLKNVLTGLANFVAALVEMPDEVQEHPVARVKAVYKITYPNGKIYAGMDLTGTLTYFGTVSSGLIAADFTPERRRDSAIRKEILWESGTASDSEVRQVEVRFIRSLASNDPKVGYNRWPRFRQASAPEIAG